MADDGPLTKSIETIEEWNMIAGEDPHKDMLYVVEIFASWCGSSQAAISTYKKIKENNEAKKFKLCKVCADMGEQEGCAFDFEPYKINPRPTFLLFKDGEQVGRVDGVSMPTLEKLIAEHMPEGLLEEEEVAADDEEGGED